MTGKRDAKGGDRTIYLLRHGELLHPCSGKHYIGRSDLALSPVGMEQARQWQAVFREVGLSDIFCSDLQRAVQTARIIAEGRRLEVVALPELREVDLGVWEGLAFETVRATDPRAYANRGRDPAGYRPPSGESFADLQARVMPAFERIATQCTGNPLIVAHAGVNRVILCHLLGMPLNHLFRIGQDPAGLNIIDARAGGFRVRAVNLPVRWRLPGGESAGSTISF
jgi:probable phosphoglycerate mutase